jgi:predicted nucleotidyltransferase
MERKESEMRLTPFQRQAIKKHFLDVFREGRIYLFGSRVDDNRKGGDIDLYIQTDVKKDLAHKKLDFLVRLKRSIGDQKIDVVFDRGLQRSIDISAQRQGILL